MIHYSRARLAFPLHRLSSGEPLPWVGLSSDYLRLTKELFVFTGAVQRAESWARQPGPSEEETLALKPDVCVGWKGRMAFQDTVCLSHNAPCEWRRSPLVPNHPYFHWGVFIGCVILCMFVCVCEREGPLLMGPLALANSHGHSVWAYEGKDGLHQPLHVVMLKCNEKQRSLFLY